jgi:hypothetical protein
LTRDAVANGAFSGARFAIFRDFFDNRYDDSGPQRKRIFAFCLAADHLADSAVRFWGTESPQFSIYRMTDERLGFHREYWKKSISAVAELIRREVSAKGTRPNGTKLIDKQTAAIALLLDPEVGPNVAKIAKLLGVRRTTIYGWPKFMARLNQARGARPGRLLRGKKSKDGTVEAFDGN